MSVASGRERLLHVGVLCALAVAQPLFDVLGRNATFFVAHRVGSGGVLLFVALLVLAPPMLILALEALAGMAGRRVQALARHAVIAILIALIVLPPLKLVAGLPASLTLGAAALAGVAAALIYGRWTPARTFLTVLSPALLVFPAVFLLDPPMRRLVFRTEVHTAAGVRVSAPAPIVMVVFDALPLDSLLDERDGIDRVRYPHFARLAEHATWYRAATAVAPVTNAAIPPIVTGRYPRGEHQPPTAAEHPQSLFTLLGGAYDLHVRETLTELCPASLCPRGDAEARAAAALRALLRDTAVVYAHRVLPDELRVRLPSIEDRWTDFGRVSEDATATTPFWQRARQQASANRDAVFAEFVQGIEASSRPALHFLHLMLPHPPWTFFPSGRPYNGPPSGAAGLVQGRWADEAAARQAELRHLLQLGFVDALVGRLIDRLHATALYDAALLVITADHGASFLPRQPYRLVTPINSADVARVPLFVKAPHQREGRVSDRNVETVDILPTVAELLGVELPWAVDGVSALAAAERADKRLVTGPQSLRLPAKIAPGPGLAARLARFGAGTPWDTLFSGGPYGALVGVRVDALDGAAAKGFVLQRRRAWTEQVDAQSPLIPALVEQALDWAPESLVTAIAVNGTIGAVVPESETSHGVRGFSALLPESLFRPGVNALELFAVSHRE